MKDRQLIVTTCGTSVLTNRAGPEVAGQLWRFANCESPDALPEGPRRVLAAHVAARGEQLRGAGVEELRSLSAELNGLLRYADGREAAITHHVLVHTDTWLGEAAARRVGEVMAARGWSVEYYRVPALRTANGREFRTGISELARWCAETLPGYRDRGYRIAFNLTGGFKSVQGFMQALAMLYADESVYLFESGDELLRLPRLPVRLDTEGVVRSHLRLFRRLGSDDVVPAAEVAPLPETLVEVADDLAALSPWGRVAWAEVEAALYGERLYDPLSARLRWSPGFVKQANAEPAERLRLLNRRLDDLAQWADSDGRYNPRSLDVKKLKVPVRGSTHECDAWSDADAKRLFAHWEGGCFVIDRLAKGLH